MKRNQRYIWKRMAALVSFHFMISIIHGTAHAKAGVLLSPAATIFVFAVILAGPLIGLALMWQAECAGSWLIALTMSAALVFGFVNHFVFSGPDHVAHVDPVWRPLFGTTAVLLAISEALGAGLAVRSVRGGNSQ